MITLRDIIREAFKKFPPKYEIVQYGEPLDHTGECMDDYEEDIHEGIRRGYIYGYADALGINASHLTQEIWKFLNQ